MNLQQLLSALQQACVQVPNGKAFLICGNGEFGIRLTWTPETTATDTPKQVCCIEGNGKATEWEELPKEEVAEEQPINTIQSQAIQESSPKKEEKAPKQQQIMQQLIGHLEEHYSFRYNRLADRTECAAKNSGEAAYMPVDQRTLNSIVLRAMDEGIACWDRDVKRYVESAHVPAYHPFIHYFNNLPEWTACVGRRPLDKLLPPLDAGLYRPVDGQGGVWQSRQQRSPHPHQHAAGSGQIHLLPHAPAQTFAGLFHRKL